MERRHYLRIASVIAIFLLLTACGGGQPASTPPAATPGAFKESEERPSPEPLKEVEIIRKTFGVRLYRGGGVAVETGGDEYVFESSFSYPGDAIGYHRFTATSGALPSPMKWKASSPDAAEFVAEFDHYSIKRSIRVSDQRVEVRETIANRGSSPVSVIIQHKMVHPTSESMVDAGGKASELTVAMPENPTFFAQGREGKLGIVIEDSLFRLQFSGSIAPGLVQFGTNRFALDVGGSYTFEWSLYPLERQADYYAFINRVRNDWDTNFTVEGPYDFFDVTHEAELLEDPGKLRKYLERKHLKIVALLPWLDYNNFNYATKTFTTREEYRRMMERAQIAFKQVDPTIKVIGGMVADLVLLPPETTRRLLDIMPDSRKAQGMYVASDEEMAVLAQASLPLKDSYMRSSDGRYTLEVYYPQPVVIDSPIKDTPAQMAIAVYAEVGNSQFDYWLDQARFILEDVGLDGLYIDQFSLVLSTQTLRYTYHKWDGKTADVDPETGRIVRMYTDGAWVGIGAQREFIRYVESKGKIIVANGPATAKEIQIARIFRFMEGASGGYDPLSFKVGEVPPFYAFFSRGHLGSPIALGYWAPLNLGQPGVDNYARVIMKTAVLYLRHGLLYYYWHTEIPEKGPGSGEYGPINHMFPITPVYIGRGFIEGKERTITAVSGTYFWRQSNEPRVLLFDMEGRLKQANARLERVPDGWSVTLDLNDWEEIAIIEE